MADNSRWNQARKYAFVRIALDLCGRYLLSLAPRFVTPRYYNVLLELTTSCRHHTMVVDKETRETIAQFNTRAVRRHRTYMMPLRMALPMAPLLLPLYVLVEIAKWLPEYSSKALCDKQLLGRIQRINDVQRGKLDRAPRSSGGSGKKSRTF